MAWEVCILHTSENGEIIEIKESGDVSDLIWVKGFAG